jgi:hypothetical protein
MLRASENPPYPDKLDPRNWVDIAELVRQIRAWDLDIIDFQLFRGFRGRDPAYLRSIKILCQQCGLPIGFLGVGRGFIGEEQVDGHTVGAALPKIELRQRIAEVKEGIDLAAFMGAPLVRLFGGGIPAESTDRDTLWQSVIRSFQEVCDYAAGKGVLVGLHNHEPVAPPTGDDILKILHDVNRENFTFILDTGRWQGSPGASPGGVTNPDIDFYAFIEQTAPHATYVRAKIYKIDSGQEEWLDYERIIEILRKVNFNGNMSIVFEGQGNQVSDLEAIGLAVDYLRGLLAD